MAPLFSDISVPLWTAIAALAAVGTALVTSVYTYLTLKLYQAQAEPKVILYVRHDRTRTTIMTLTIENIGRDVAFDVQFTPSRPIPKKAHGISSDTTVVARRMEDGPLIDGIPALEPGGTRVITWGQCGGLTKALEGKPITVEVSYSHKGRRLTNKAILEVASFLNNDASDPPMNMIPKRLDEIREQLRSIAANVHLLTTQTSGREPKK